MPVTFANGRDIHYSDVGDKSNPVLILAHGFFMDRSMFTPQHELQDEWRIITWDARGHGESRDSTTDEYTYWDQARDCLALMDVLDIGSATVGGMSQGGYIALRVALLSPQRVSGLVLIDTESGSSDAAEIQWYEEFFESLVLQGPVDEIVLPLADRLIGPMELSAPWVAVWKQQDFSNITPAADCLMYRDDLESRLSEITCPSVVIHGSRDQAVPTATARMTSESLSGHSQLFIIEGGSHSSNITHPDQVNEAIRSLSR